MHINIARFLTLFEALAAFGAATLTTAVPLHPSSSLASEPSTKNAAIAISPAPAAAAAAAVNSATIPPAGGASISPANTASIPPVPNAPPSANSAMIQPANSASVPPANGASIPLAFIAPPPKQTLGPPQQPDKPAEAKVQSLKKPDNGYLTGNIVIFNWCLHPVYMRSVGAYYLGGFRDANNNKTSWGTPEDDVVHAIKPNEKYTEPYRASGGCNYVGAPPYCPDEDKLAGQAVSMKIAKTADPADTAIMQFEYALYHHPNATQKNYRTLVYDVSLLDCGKPDVNATDFNATREMHDKKVRDCPGYQGGVSVTFNNDTDNANRSCPLIYCNGQKKSLMIYTWDRTRKMESTFTCEREYRGDTRLDLCAANGDNKNAAQDFDNWAQKATHEVVLLELGKMTYSPPAAAPTTSAASPPTTRTVSGCTSCLFTCIAI